MEDPTHKAILSSLECPKQRSFSPGIFVKNNQVVKNSQSFNIGDREATGNRVNSKIIEKLERKRRCLSWF